jgi:hypothetical protein
MNFSKNMNKTFTSKKNIFIKGEINMKMIYAIIATLALSLAACKKENTEAAAPVETPAPVEAAVEAPAATDAAAAAPTEAAPATTDAAAPATTEEKPAGH